MEIVGPDSQVFGIALKGETPPGLRPQVDWKRIETLARELLLAIGEDPDREGLRETPRRYAKVWREFIEHDAGNVATYFEPVTTDQMVVVGGVPVWSFCEHHLLPFSCKVTVGYIAEDRVLGLSKIARIVVKHAHRLQVQERLVHGVADEISRLANTRDVAVLAQGEHTCMAMRGVEKQAAMTTSVLRGTFRNSMARDEFLRITLGGGSRG